jgi:hypothetical protein
MSQPVPPKNRFVYLGRRGASHAWRMELDGRVKVLLFDLSAAVEFIKLHLRPGGLVGIDLARHAELVELVEDDPYLTSLLGEPGEVLSAWPEPWKERKIRVHLPKRSQRLCPQASRRITRLHRTRT